MSTDELEQGADLEQPSGGITLARRSTRPPSVIWHAWLTTLNGRPVGRRTDLPRPALVSDDVRARGPALDLDDPTEWQRLWLAAQRRPWRSLAVIPAGGGIPTPRVAEALVQVGSRHLGRPMLAADATSMTLDRLEASVGAWIEQRGSIDRVIIALGPVLESPASFALAQAADAAILCVSRGRSAISAAARTIEEIGKDRFLGTVLLREGELR